MTRLNLNGTPVEAAADPGTPLLDVLRGEMGLVGTRFGCGAEACGACFVLLDGAAVASCTTPLSAVEGRDVVTVEGLAPGDELHPVQQAILDEQAGQCGYCLSGIMVSAAGLLARDPHPDEAAVIAALDRNLCRCGVQRRVVRAVLRAAGAEVAR
ncbi:nicotinate dehydrogenase subunit A [Nonomuraea maritima]|uniref:Nicotinate dehydrogenase subunit A n=1 Tax=Nonomuraea maritima TaxID=683260 RepID=A0A1G8SGN4_9ACTN|nr:(2Fe-2S)-binding protein [Nonomuraea maritima]SDJ28314.1 nicotinate dehydrogenase subunit A [Nonomuraea maritima]